MLKEEFQCSFNLEKFKLLIKKPVIGNKKPNGFVYFNP